MAVQEEMTTLIQTTHNTTPAAYAAGAMSAVYGTLSTHDIAVWVGLLCTVGTFIVNLWFQMKADARAEADRREDHAEHLIRVQGYTGPERRGRGSERAEGPSADPLATAHDARAPAEGRSPEGAPETDLQPRGGVQ